MYHEPWCTSKQDTERESQYYMKEFQEGFRVAVSQNDEMITSPVLRLQVLQIRNGAATLILDRLLRSSCRTSTIVANINNETKTFDE